MSGKVKFPEATEALPVLAGGVKAEWLVPAGAAENKVILYLHGGGYCLGIVNTNRNFVARVASESGCKVLLADYRLAPENPYPAAVEDVLAAYRWLLSEGFLPENIVIAADSSGCGLTLAALITLRDNGEPLPAALAFMSPVVDLKNMGESMKTRADTDPFQLKPEFYIANYYVADHDPAAPLISPLYAELQGLPPMLIHGSDYDIFLSDSVRLAEKALKAGVDVTLKVWEKMWHNFHMSAGLLPEGRAALREIYSFINEKLA